MNNLKKLALWKSIVFYSMLSLYFMVVTHFGIPYLTKRLFFHPALSWFIAGYFVFVPLFILGIFFVKREGNGGDFSTILKRLRIKKLSKKDGYWTLGATAVILTLTGAVMMEAKILATTFGTHQLQTTPSFMQFNTLHGNERLYLFIWLPMFFFNIVGEGMLWHGYLLPRQELRHGNKAWLVNASLWLVFHLCIGMDLLILLLPALLIIPYLTQKTKNTLPGMIAHALLNGPMFVLITLGIIG